VLVPKTVNAGKRFSLWLFGPAVSRYALALAYCGLDRNHHELVILSAVLPLKAVSLMLVRAAVVRAREV
jgi:K+ transporter